MRNFYDEDPWAEQEAMETERLDADLEMAELAAAGNAIAAARKAGKCAHQGAMGYLAGEDRGLKRGQLKCNDGGNGCGRVFASDAEWQQAMDEVMYG